MKKKIETISVERDRQGKTTVAIFRGDKRKPKLYFPVTDRSAKRIALYIWDNGKDFRVIPTFLNPGWMATLRESYQYAQREGPDHDDALPVQYSRGRKKLFKD
jgi:hypothetical protein